MLVVGHIGSTLPGCSACFPVENEHVLHAAPFLGHAASYYWQSIGALAGPIDGTCIIRVAEIPRSLTDDCIPSSTLPGVSRGWGVQA